MLTDLEKAKAAASVLPAGYVIVPIESTRGMLEQVAFNLSAEYGPEKVRELEAFARDVYAEFINAGKVR